VNLFTSDMIHSLQIPSKATGFGSSVNGEELLFLALATCFCNELYSEAEKKGIVINSIDVKVEGTFGEEDEQAGEIRYSAIVKAEAGEKEILELMHHTDAMAVIQNILRRSARVTLHKAVAISTVPTPLKPDIFKSFLHPLAPVETLMHITDQVDVHHPLFI
jgi:organic hydroperoxide reductase OsmC/OhrA